MDFKKQKDAKAARREKKKIDKRDITGEEVIYIFTQFLAGWKTIRIYNTMIQTNPASHVTKRKVEQVATGNCKVFEKEFNSPERFYLYKELREKVYAYRKAQKQAKKESSREESNFQPAGPSTSV